MLSCQLRCDRCFRYQFILSQLQRQQYLGSWDYLINNDNKCTKAANQRQIHGRCTSATTTMATTVESRRIDTNNSFSFYLSWFFQSSAVVLPAGLRWPVNATVSKVLLAFRKWLRVPISHGASIIHRERQTKQIFAQSNFVFYFDSSSVWFRFVSVSTTSTCRWPPLPKLRSNVIL